MSEGYVGRVVALTGCPAYRDGSDLPGPVSGLFRVEEFQPIEPSAYAWSAYFTVYRVGSEDDSDAPFWSVDVDDLEAQVDLGTYGRRLAEDRWSELAGEAGL